MDEQFLREFLKEHLHIEVWCDYDGIICFGHWENDFRKAMKGD